MTHSSPGVADDAKRRLQALRLAVEDQTRDSVRLSLDVVQQMAHDEIQLLFYELRVHQIELEQQNEELTESKNELEASRARYFDLYDMAPVGYCSINGQGHIQHCNLTLASLLGVPRKELIGRHFSRYICGQDQDGFYKACAKLPPQASATPRESLALVFDYELQMHRADRSTLWAHLNAVEDTQTESETNAERPWLRVAITDITLQKHAQANHMMQQKQLDDQRDEMANRTVELGIANEHAQRASIASIAKSNFLANMSHEIRTPLSAISGMAKLIQMEPLSTTQANRMQKLEASVLHLSSTINDILDLSKIEANKLVLDEVSVNMDDLVDQVVHMLLHRTEAKGLQLHVHVDRMPLGLLGDTTRLTQTLLNFAGNAVKFTNKGSISIAASILEDGVGDALVKFEVQDTGVGIADETIETLFQPFVQADTSTTRQHGGTGLGLVISKRLAEAMGGTIGFHSEFGTGSTFWFTARLRKSSLIENFVPYVPIEDAALTLKRDYAGRRVLLAEDDEFNREIGEILLQNVGLLVDLAVDGQEAVETALRNKYDLVLMDMQMPKMDGLEATRCIRSASGNSMSIVAMTANAFVEDRESCMEAGMNDFITKPVDPSKLYKIILRELKSRDI